jgi:hypothetical protein
MERMGTHQVDIHKLWRRRPVRVSDGEVSSAQVGGTKRETVTFIFIRGRQWFLDSPDVSVDAEANDTQSQGQLLAQRRFHWRFSRLHPPAP